MQNCSPRVIAVADMFGVAGRRDELLALLSGAERDFGEQPGCVRYSVARTLVDPDHFLIVSEWRDQEALEVHYASQIFDRFQYALNGLLKRPSETTLHTVGESTKPVASGPMDPRDAD